MSWMVKTRFSASPAAPASKPGPMSTMAASPNARVSNGLKEFISLIGETNQGRVLDLGQVSQATITFFIERGYRLSTEDMLRSWKEYLTQEEEHLRLMPLGEDGERVSQASLAEKFLESSLQYPPENFIGVITWDLFDYLDAELMPRVIERLYTLLRPGGAVLSMFHSRPPERFHRYRIVDGQSIELLSAPTLAVHARVFRNREILDTFGRFRSSKAFVGRDQLREGLFLK
jgi:SAM-dependent methyltransferase